MSVKAAITEVLKKAKSPLHAKAIAEQIIAAGLWTSDDKTSEAP
jgi:restriction system protein